MERLMLFKLRPTANLSIYSPIPDLQSLYLPRRFTQLDGSALGEFLDQRWFFNQLYSWSCSRSCS